jgi:hypothetical protein
MSHCQSLGPTQAQIDEIQKGCACKRLDACDCTYACAGMPFEWDEGGREAERCECPCHAEIDALTRDDD